MDLSIVGLEFLVQAKFKVCVGVRSGPKSPVMDLSIVGLASLSKQNFKVCAGVRTI